MSCISGQQVLDFVAGKLESGALAEVERHVDSCDVCRVSVAELARKTAPAGSASPSRDQVGRYQIIEPIGAGGMGVVYRALDPELGRRVALKLLRPNLGGTPGEARVRIQREARAMARVAHPSVVSIHDVGVHDEQVFVVMELVEGGTLRDWLAREKRDWRAVLHALREAGSGLAAAHAAGLVHRDFKPDNVLIGADGHARVTDFGLARPAGAGGAADPAAVISAESLSFRVTSPGTVAGSPAYMAPEVMRGGEADSRSDVFSFCVTAWESLYSELPFAGSTLPQIAENASRGIVRQPPAGEVPDAVRGVLLRGLSARPEDRFDSVGELLDALEAAAAAPIKRKRALVIASIGVLAAAAAAVFLLQRSKPALPRSIAVLPFASLSPGDEDAKFADAVHLAVIRQLSQIGDLRVISRASVMLYRDGAKKVRDVAAALNVSHVLEGDVQREGNRVRMQVRLIDAASDRRIWEEHYDRELTDLFIIQAAVAEQIARVLHAHLLPDEVSRMARQPTANAEAYAAYLRAWEINTRRGAPFDQDVPVLEQLYGRAIELDPAFALAWARLSILHAWTYWFHIDHSEARLAQTRVEAERAVALQPDLAEAHSALGIYYSWCARDLDRALKEFEIARRGDPSIAFYMGTAQRRRGDFEASVRFLQEAAALDPRNLRVFNEISLSSTYLRRYDEAARAVERARMIAPDLPGPRAARAYLMLVSKGDLEPTRAVLREYVASPPTERLQGGILTELIDFVPQESLEALKVAPPVIASSPFVYRARSQVLGMAHEALGDVAQARREYDAAVAELTAAVGKDPEDPLRRMGLALALAAVDRKDDALREARRAVEILPLAKDGLVGPVLLEQLAAVEARVGESDAAIDRLRQLLTIPARLSPAILRIDPKWNPLRGDPRFHALLERENPE